MGNGVWATGDNGVQEVCGTWAMGYRLYGVHGADGQWGTCNGLQGYGVHGGIGHMDNVAHG